MKSSVWKHLLVPIFICGGVVLCVGALLAIPTMKKKYTEWFVFPELREHVTKNLLDPSSTQYRNEIMSSFGVICGELNTKNSSGGFVGFQRYISNEHHQYLESLGSLKKGTLSEAQYLIALQNERIEILEEFNALLKANPDFRVPSEKRRQELAVARFFDRRWKELCGDHLSR